MAKISKAFVADLPEMSEEQLEKLYSWGKSSCEQFDVHLQGGGAMTLVAVRKKAGSARDHMRLLRTNLQNWGVSLPAKLTGWLRLVDEAAPVECKLPRTPAVGDTCAPEEGFDKNEPLVESSATINAQEFAAGTAPFPKLPCASQLMQLPQLTLPKNLLTSHPFGGHLCRAA